MKNHDIAFIGCRFISLWLFVQILINMASVIWILSDYVKMRNSSMMGLDPELNRAYASYIMLITTLVIQFIIGLVLWKRAPRFARMIVSGTEEQNAGPLDCKGAMRVVVAAIGLFALLATGPKVAVPIMINIQTDGVFLRGLAEKISFLVNAITVVLGILAILKNQMIANYLLKTPKESQDRVSS